MSIFRPAIVAVTTLALLLGATSAEPAAAAPTATEGLLSAEASAAESVRVRLKKRNKLVDGAEVKLKVRGYSGSFLSVSQCPRGADDALTHLCRPLGMVSASANGPANLFVGQLTPKRHIRFRSDDIDCFDRNACELRIDGYADDTGTVPLGSVGINFDSDAPSVAPKLSMRPNRQLVDNQRVTVTVKNFTSERSIVEASIWDADGHCGDRLKHSIPFATRKAVKFDVSITQFACDTDCADRGSRCELRVVIMDGRANTTDTLSLPMRFKKI